MRPRRKRLALHHNGHVPDGAALLDDRVVQNNSVGADGDAVLDEERVDLPDAVLEEVGLEAVDVVDGAVVADGEQVDLGVHE